MLRGEGRGTKGGGERTLTFTASRGNRTNRWSAHVEWDAIDGRGESERWRRHRRKGGSCGEGAFLP